MNGDLEWLDIEWMRDARRDQAFEAAALALYAQADAIRCNEEAHIRARGGAWSADAERRYRVLMAVASFLDAVVVGARGVAIQVVAANKKAGAEHHKMPVWIEKLGDQLKASFLAPIDENTLEGVKDAEPNAALESVA